MSTATIPAMNPAGYALAVRETEAILALFAGGSWHSAESIAREIGINRNRVSNRLQSLAREGRLDQKWDKAATWRGRWIYRRKTECVNRVGK